MFGGVYSILPLPQILFLESLMFQDDQKWYYFEGQIVEFMEKLSGEDANKGLFFHMIKGYFKESLDNPKLESFVANDRTAHQFAEARRQFEFRLKQKEEAKAKLEDELRERHKAFLKKKGLRFSEVKFVEQQKSPRITNCYNCSNKNLRSDVNLICISCGWLICSCGACGCGYSYK
jgi:hypothetical protein